MRGPILLVVRRLHLYLSVFFAPLLLLFVITGWAQTMDFDHATPVLERLSKVHTQQFFSTAPRGQGKPTPAEREAQEAAAVPMKWLVAAMSVALIVSIALGLVLAFTLARQRVAVWIALILGIATPVLLLALAHF